MPKIMLKSPEEYQRELELYKQLKNNVYSIFKLPEFQRQEMVQALKLEGEAKDTARELSRIERETKERPVSLSADDEEYLRLFNTINTLLNDGEDLFNIAAIQAMNKDELEDTKDLLQKIKKQDIGSGNMEKTRYINKSINLINQKLNSKITTKKSVIKPKQDLGAVGGDGDGEEKQQIKSVAVSESVSLLPNDIRQFINSASYKTTPKKLEKKSDDERKKIYYDLIDFLDLLKKSDLDKSTKNKLKQNIKKRTDKIISLVDIEGKGLSKKSKSKSKPKSKSNLGTQDQIYYILSKRAGNNNKLMKKRLKK